MSFLYSEQINKLFKKNMPRKKKNVNCNQYLVSEGRGKILCFKISIMLCAAVKVARKNGPKSEEFSPSVNIGCSSIENFLGKIIPKEVPTP